MKKRIGILGATGSIGCQTLEVIREFRDEFNVVALTTHGSVDLVSRQAHEFNPEVVGITASRGCEEATKEGWCEGAEVLVEIAQMELDILVVAVVGTAGLRPSLKALELGTDVALANKEVLVVAGNLIKQAERESSGQILPVDSEHSALYQSLGGENHEEIKRMIITASGGPFLEHSRKKLKNVSVQEALDHPNWEMGSKITVDSATMMNKGLEIIEACRLFDLEPEQVRAFIHPQSTVHGLVEYVDNSMIAQCSRPDMRLPIQYALFYPARRAGLVEPVDFSEPFSWDFEPIDFRRFPAYRLAREALESGASFPAVLNAANEVAVEAFLNKEIPFLEIPVLIEKTLEAHEPSGRTDLETMLSADSWAREYVKELM